ncbi:hypothetical protein XF35_04750 [Streptomyces platensis subsp. clarensis]|nr:hypothetical protein [Streptomyces platensis subsp. clarensis]
MELLRFYGLERLTGTQLPEPGAHPHTGTTHLPCPKRGFGFGFDVSFRITTSRQHCPEPSNGA